MSGVGFGFFAARIGVGVLGFVMVAVFSRLMPPDDYGRYALVMGGAATVNACCFSWMGLCVLRLCRDDGVEREEWLSTVIVVFLGMAVLVLAACGVGWLVFGGGMPDELYYLPAIALLVAWFELSIQVSRARLQPRVFAAKSFAKALLTLLFGTGFLLMGWTGQGLLLGVVAAFGVVTLIWIRADVCGFAVLCS
jgi:O-antigen/teichoic acid export membrane protein